MSPGGGFEGKIEAGNSGLHTAYRIVPATVEVRIHVLICLWRNSNQSHRT